MRLKTRGLLVAALALVAFSAAATSASALTVSPTGAYTASSGTTRLSLPSNGQALSCTSSRIATANLSAAGAGTVARGNAVYTSCTNPILGTFTVTQSTDWTLNVVLVSGAVNLVVTLPRGGVTLSGPGCTFTVSGAVTLQQRTSGLPASINSGAVVSDTLAIDGNNGGLLCGFFPAGLAADYSASYTLSRSATVSG